MRFLFKLINSKVGHKSTLFVIIATGLRNITSDTSSYDKEVEIIGFYFPLVILFTLEVKVLTLIDRVSAIGEVVVNILYIRH